MQPQQQTVVTTPDVVQPTYISQPYLSASVVNSYRHRQSTIIGILLIIVGVLIIPIYFVDLLVWGEGIAGHCYWCGAMVSSQLSI